MSRTILFGLDGAAFNVLEDLVARGVMPYLGRFISEGTRATLLSTEPPLTPEQMLAEFTPEEVAEVGGAECAGELASLFVAAQNYVAEQGKDPDTIDDLTGHLDQTIDLWVVENGSLRPAPGSGCTEINDTSDPQTQACETGAKTLQVARQAYFSQMGQDSEPNQQQLVEIGFLREANPDLDLEDGVVVAVAGGACEGVDLGL